MTPGLARYLKDYAMKLRGAVLAQRTEPSWDARFNLECAAHFVAGGLEEIAREIEESERDELNETLEH